MKLVHGNGGSKCGPARDRHACVTGANFGPQLLRYPTGGGLLALLLSSAAANAQSTPPAESPAAASPAVATAQPVPGDIVVTANKRKENLQNVPLAVSAVTSEQLTRGGINDTLALASRIPGLNMQSSMNGTQPHLRGVGTTSIAAGEENSIATYIDGVYVASVSGTLLQLDNIQQIEVLKGPQGTLFGRNATGGVINITTKDPSHEFGGSAQLGYSNFNTITAGTYLTGGLTNDIAANLAVRYVNQGKGWGRNLYSGKEVNKENEFAARTKIVATPSDRDRVVISLDYAESKGPARSTYRPAYGQPSNYGPGATTAAQRPDLLPYILSGAIPNPAITVGNPYTFTGGFWDVDSYYEPAFHYKGGGGSLHYSHDFAFGQVATISSYRKTDKTSTFSPTPLPTPLSGSNFREKSSTHTEELQITSEPRSRVKWAAGVFYLDGSVGYPFFDLYGEVNAPVTRVSFKAVESTKSIAAYGQVTIPLPAKSNLTAGLRYTTERRGITGNTQLFFGPGSPLVVQPTDASKRFKKVTWRLTLDHHFTDGIMAYASVNRGFKSGVYDTIPPGGPDARPVEPEVLDAYEVGLKTQFFDRQLTANISAFYYKYSNLQVNVFNSITAQLQNGAAAKIYGVDLDVVTRPTRALTISGGLELLHDRFTSFPKAQFAIPQPASLGGGNLLVVGEAAGNHLPYTPTFTGHISLDYKIPTHMGNFVLGTTYAYNSGFYAGPDNILKSPHYGLLDASLDWELLNGTTTVSLWGKNLKNARYYTQMAAVFNPNGENVVIPGAPRTYGVTLRQRF